MDHVPIYKSSDAESGNTLHVGVEVRYEANDAEHLLHMLRFLEAYEEEQSGKFTLFPAVTHDGNTVTRAWLLDQIEKIPEGSRLIRGTISVHFLDEMRPAFVAYLKTLREIKRGAEKEYEWDGTHPFFPLTDHFEYVARKFFPDKTAMN